LFNLNFKASLYLKIIYQFMLLRPADNYFQMQDEPNKSCLLFLREYILSRHQLVTEVWQYGMPFYCFNKHRFCYLWVHKKYKQPYLGVVKGKLITDPDLITENRSRMKILLINPQLDIPVEKISCILKQAIDLCSSTSV